MRLSFPTMKSSQMPLKIRIEATVQNGGLRIAITNSGSWLAERMALRIRPYCGEYRGVRFQLGDDLQPVVAGCCRVPSLTRSARVLSQNTLLLTII